MKSRAFGDYLVLFNGSTFGVCFIAHDLQLFRLACSDWGLLLPSSGSFPYFFPASDYIACTIKQYNAHCAHNGLYDNILKGGVIDG